MGEEGVLTPECSVLPAGGWPASVADGKGGMASCAAPAAGLAGNPGPRTITIPSRSSENRGKLSVIHGHHLIIVIDITRKNNIIYKYMQSQHKNSFQGIFKILAWVISRHYLFNCQLTDIA